MTPPIVWQNWYDPVMSSTSSFFVYVNARCLRSHLTQSDHTLDESNGRSAHRAPLHCPSELSWNQVDLPLWWSPHPSLAPWMRKWVAKAAKAAKAAEAAKRFTLWIDPSDQSKEAAFLKGFPNAECMMTLWHRNKLNTSAFWQGHRSFDVSCSHCPAQVFVASFSGRSWNLTLVSWLSWFYIFLLSFTIEYHQISGFKRFSCSSQGTFDHLPEAHCAPCAPGHRYVARELRLRTTSKWHSEVEPGPGMIAATQHALLLYKDAKTNELKNKHLRIYKVVTRPSYVCCFINTPLNIDVSTINRSETSRICRGPPGVEGF